MLSVLCRLRSPEEQTLFDTRQALERAKYLKELERAASVEYEKAERAQELRGFGRLPINLALLGVAGWLFAKTENGLLAVCLGFIYFALFAFFVELVPYLLKAGGFICYVVGIVVTVLVDVTRLLAQNLFKQKQVYAGC